MNNERQPKNHKVRSAGILATAGLAIAMASAACGNSEVKPSNSVSLANANDIELATPKASVAGATPEPSKAPEAVKIETFHLVPGDKFQTKAGDVVIGDIAMADADTTDTSKIKFLFDTDSNKAAGKDNTKTGLLVDVQKDGIVLAPYGGDVIRGLQGDKKTTWIELKKAEMENGGCVGGCTDGVPVVEWTGFDTTLDEAQTMTKDAGGVVTPSANPSAELPSTGNITNTTGKEQLLAVLTGEGFKNLPAAEQQRILELLIQCICSGPVATPEPTPTPTASPEAACDTANDTLLKSGEKLTVKGNDFIVQGDVIIDGKRLYDNSAKTGAIDAFTDGKTHNIVAPYGADVQIFCATATDQTEKDLYNKDLEQLTSGSGRTLDKNSVNQLN